MSTKDRFRTRTLVMLALALAVVALCTGCSERIDTLVRFVESKVTGEEYVSPRGQACLDAAEGLLGALEAGDGDAIVGLFSPEARTGSDNLDEQAGELVESCSGHVGYLDTHSVTRPMESEKVEDGRRRVELSTDFSFVLDGENYWCYMTLVSVNDFDEAEVGVSTVIVWSEDAYSAMLYDARETDWPEGMGLHLRLSYPLEWETRLVNDDPLRYEAGDTISDVDEVTAFLDGGEKTVDDFEERFGRPCCVSWTGDGRVYYELDDREGPRYLEVNATAPDEPIYSAYVVDERGVVEKVWDADGDA
ncbi:MAG TPA: DUF5104 domain-containing protein [Candidatus Olsenella excrementavium]|uniref:DUF5104 domain-containing protein n=1 Tax=Candidatus Olsenella excrementavium TaxID=2838709 RepID=A0A9D1ZAM5_9ACTN|nr:DUF5104 domain-containing protein [Candidatus Olsenella excrementavium]